MHLPTCAPGRLGVVLVRVFGGTQFEEPSRTGEGGAVGFEAHSDLRPLRRLKRGGFSEFDRPKVLTRPPGPGHHLSFFVLLLISSTSPGVE